jgi:hypothetical protein
VTMATLVARNVNEAMVAPMVGSDGVCGGGSLESGGRFCVGKLGRKSGFSNSKYVFTFDLLYKEIVFFYFECYLQR